MAKKPVQKKREYSRPELSKMMVLNTEMSMQAFNDYVKRTMAALYRLDVILFFIGSEEMAIKANEKIEKVLRELMQRQMKENRNLEAIVEKLSDEGVDIEMPEYPMQLTQDFKIYSPLCAYYLKVFSKFESNVRLIEALWMNGEMSSDLKYKKIRRLSIGLRNVSHRIINQSRATMEVARNEGKEKDVSSSIKKMGFEDDDGLSTVNEKQAKQDLEQAEKEALQAENKELMNQSFDDALMEKEKGEAVA